ncbi:hypothetical protein GALMADRAFT_75833 [Galerina marginata CBS 339.88]|uniref:Uncharacterized protein n=1 Tax=Galerina marginata (strain CBS 339.88) TaxID=685588 RepID=A0A067SI53_GALM3|nr:hypothetical protein GALMADRAFT_75833 [Galerina marginata CBS 339.88]
MCAADDASPPEEVVASLQGIICKADLPPFRERISTGSRQIRYIRQSVTLTAFGDAMFDLVGSNIAEVHALFGRIVGADQLQECSMFANFEGYAAVEMSNRYFTPKNEASGATEIGLTDEIDPQGSLRKAAGAGYVHTDDNQVGYYERQVKGADYLYINAAPVIFQVGDIVDEVQVSFAVLPLREGKLKMSMTLRSITLFDGSLSQVCIETPQLTLKRRVGYYEEEVSVTRAKFTHMEIDDEAAEKRAGDPEGSVKKGTGIDKVD